MTKKQKPVMPAGLEPPVNPNGVQVPPPRSERLRDFDVQAGDLTPTGNCYEWVIYQTLFVQKSDEGNSSAPEYGTISRELERRKQEGNRGGGYT
jgi:hypothetical protein